MKLKRTVLLQTVVVMLGLLLGASAASGAVPEPATLISPSDTITDNTPTYTWNAVADSTWYYLWVNDSTQDKKILLWYTALGAGCGDGTGECSATPETVLADGAVKWWIQTWNDDGYGDWSAGLSFTVDTSAPPEPATLISPSGTITDNTPTYTWNAVANAAQYILFVWDSTQTPIIVQPYTAAGAGCTDDRRQCTVTPETVLAYDSHEWWIRTFNDNGKGDWSDGMSFTVGESIPPAPVPRTGQTQSYGAGDDGDLQKGVPWPDSRFTDNDDGTVTDHLTGLIWLKCAYCSVATWDDAMDFISDCEDGAACGGTILTDGSKAGDWRLPNRRELESLMDFSRSRPALPAGHPFSYEENRSVMWTSTTYPENEGQGAWLIDMDSGEVAVGEKTLARTYWAVRDGN